MGEINCNKTRTYIFMFEKAEHLELAEDAFGGDEWLENVG